MDTIENGGGTSDENLYSEQYMRRQNAELQAFEVRAEAEKEMKESSRSRDKKQKKKKSHKDDKKSKHKAERKSKKEKRKREKELKKRLKLTKKLTEKTTTKAKDSQTAISQKTEIEDDEYCGPSIDLMNRAKCPETREQWEQRQSQIKRVVDPETGRTRLIKGDGEILEEIVTRDRHKQINQEATRNDGYSFQMNTVGSSKHK